MTIRPTGISARGERVSAVLGLSPGPDFSVQGVSLDSRAVRPGDLYAALPGFVTHGARFAGDAIRAGASAILTDPLGRDILDALGVAGHVPVLTVAEPRSKLGELSAEIYGHPARRLRITGITGTNGKTTTCYLLDAALRAAGWRTAVIGTVGTRIGDDVLPAARTTPEAPDLHALLAVMVEQGVQAVSMEVSSHALSLGRVDGIVFDVVAYTNLTQDHLDFHGDMQSYFEAKSALFTADRAESAVICVDDAWGRVLVGRCPVPLRTVSTRGEADWSVREVNVDRLGRSTFRVRGPQGLEVASGVSLPGAFNVANALTALAIAERLGVPPEVAAPALTDSPGVPGRMERIDAGQPFVALVDYAHTPDAVRRALRAVREVVEPGRGRLLAVLGAGGDRDAGKRRPMGRELAEGADVAVITDDNPRSESPAAIRAEIMSGTVDVDPDGRAEVLEVADRQQAIELVVQMAQPGDAVIVLGKGHEQGQEVAGVVHHFDDRDVIRRALAALS